MSAIVMPAKKASAATSSSVRASPTLAPSTISIGVPTMPASGRSSSGESARAEARRTLAGVSVAVSLARRGAREDRAHVLGRPVLRTPAERGQHAVRGDPVADDDEDGVDVLRELLHLEGLQR